VPVCTAIFAWVEIHAGTNPRRDGVIQAVSVLEQDPEALRGSLRRRGGTHCTPLAAGRGLPPDTSREVLAEAVGEAPHSVSWLTWTALQAMPTDTETFTYRTWSEQEWRSADGQRVDRWESNTRAPQELLEEPGATAWEDATHVDVRILVPDDLMDGSATITHTFQKLRRRDLFLGRWRLLFSLMSMLAVEFGPDNVRLVAWLLG
jgi:hypothetical protein